MAFDAHKNLAISVVVTPPAPAASGTSLVLTAGHGVRFPAAPFDVTVWALNEVPTPVNAEVARCTALVGDTMTLTRAQGGTTARAIVAGDLIAATISAKTLTDIESGVNFPLITTPGAGSFGGDLILATNGVIRRNTPDGADNGTLAISAGGAAGTGRGASFTLCGNESSFNGSVYFAAGENPLSTISFYTGPTAALRGMMHPSGGFSWGSATDPGAGVFCVGNPATVGLNGCHLGPYAGYSSTGLAVSNQGSSAANCAVFVNATGVVGYILTNGGTTTYGTTSDQRLKTDHGRLTETDVLRRTVIHNFIWKHDGAPGRGVFAQEAITVAPFAVTEGTDERDDEGRLTHPWGVDYSKFVPDLIVGWQQQQTRIEQLEATVSTLEARLAALEAKLA